MLESSIYNFSDAARAHEHDKVFSIPCVPALLKSAMVCLKYLFPSQNYISDLDLNISLTLTSFLLLLFGQKKNQVIPEYQLQ